MARALLRNAVGTAVGDSEHLVASVLEAARESLDLDLRYEFEPDLGAPESTVPIQAADGRFLGLLRSEAALENAERRAVQALAKVIASHIGGDDWAEHKLKVQADRVRGVLARQAIQVALQPIFDLESGRVAGVEALARFPSTPRLSPEVLFAEAEAVGLGQQLEWAAARAALDQLATLADRLFLAINTSPATAIDRCLREAMRGLPHDRIVLEMTEHSPVDDYDEFGRRLDRRRAEGVRVAIDDVGAGFASMRHILGLRPSIIKLDISLVRGIDRDPLRQSLARSLVSFARSMSADVVAEGIETQAELRRVRRLGIPLGQGFLLGRPELAGDREEPRPRSAGAPEQQGLGLRK